MADEEEFVLQNDSSFNFLHKFEEDLQIIYSKYCRPFDEEEILLSVYTDKDDKLVEELFTKIAGDYESDSDCDSDCDSDTSGPTSRANTTQDGVSELDEEPSQSSSVNEKINRKKDHNLNTGLGDCIEDFPIPIAESTRRDIASDHEALDVPQYTCDPEHIPDIASDHEALDVPHYTCDPEHIPKSPAEKGNNTEAVIRASLTSPTKLKDTTKRISVDRQARSQLHNNVSTIAARGSHDLATIVLQTRNRIANALVDAFKTRDSTQQGARNRHNRRNSTKLLSVRWTPASSTATEKSIKLLSRDNSHIWAGNCNVPSIARPLPPLCLKERIILKSRVCIATDPKSDSLTISCYPKSVLSLLDAQLPKRKQSLVLPTNRALKSSFQSGDGEQRLNSVVFNRPALTSPVVGAVKHSAKLPTRVSPASPQAFIPDTRKSSGNKRLLPFDSTTHRQSSGKTRGMTDRKDAEVDSRVSVFISDTQRKMGNSSDTDRINKKDILLSANCHALAKDSHVSLAKLTSTASDTRPNEKMTVNGKQKAVVACKFTPTNFSSKRNGRKSSASGNYSAALGKETGNKDERLEVNEESLKTPCRRKEILASNCDIFTFEGHDKLVKRPNRLSELPRVRRGRSQSGSLSRGNEKISKQCPSDNAPRTPTKRLQSESQEVKTVSATKNENSKVKIVTLRTKDSQSRVKTTSSTRLTKTSDFSTLGQASIPSLSPIVSLTTDSKRLVADDSSLLIATCPPKDANVKGKTSKSVIRQSPVGHQTARLTVCEAPCVKTNSRKRNADSEICGTVYRVSKKVCRTAGEADFPNDTDDVVASQLRCKGPGKCLKSFCFECSQFSDQDTHSSGKQL